MRRWANWAKLLLICAASCCADAFALDHGVACTRANRIKSVKISKPLGIIVEEADGNDPSQGVCIGSIDEGGNAMSAGENLCLANAIRSVSVCRRDSTLEAISALADVNKLAKMYLKDV